MSEQSQKNATEAAKAAKEAHAEAQRVRDAASKVYGKRLEKMSHRQLRGEIKSALRDKAGEKAAGIELIIAGIILDTTRSEENPKGRVGIFPV